MDENKTPERSDKTVRLETVEASQQRTEQSLTSLAKSTKFWISFVLFLCAGTAAGAKYVFGFARIEAIEKTNDRIDAANDRLGKVEAQMGVQLQLSQDIKENMVGFRDDVKAIRNEVHWQSRQSSEIAKATGAGVLKQTTTEGAR